jgi:hypothetical protein
VAGVLAEARGEGCKEPTAVLCILSDGSRPVRATHDHAARQWIDGSSYRLSNQALRSRRPSRCVAAGSPRARCRFGSIEGDEFELGSLAIPFHDADSRESAQEQAIETIESIIARLSDVARSFRDSQQGSDKAIKPKPMPE